VYGEFRSLRFVNHSRETGEIKIHSTDISCGMFVSSLAYIVGLRHPQVTDDILPYSKMMFDVVMSRSQQL